MHLARSRQSPLSVHSSTLVFFESNDEINETDTSNMVYNEDEDGLINADPAEMFGISGEIAEALEHFMI